MAAGVRPSRPIFYLNDFPISLARRGASPQMKILIQSINFHPELTGIGKYTGEMAEWFALRGHSVRVITSPPYYPHWEIDRQYRKYFWSRESWGTVEIWRCPIWVPKNPSGLKRLIHLASFACSGLPIMFFQIFWRPNIVLTIEPPLFSAPAALLVARLIGARSVLHIQDYEVDAAFNLGLLKGDFIRSMVLRVEVFLLRRFDLVSTISKRMIDKAVSKGLDPSRLFFFPNWVNVQSSSVVERKNSESVDVESLLYRKKFGIPAGGVVALYSGNMGAKQGLEILGEIARIYKENQSSLFPIYFVFCGDGVSRKNLEMQCADFNFVYFVELQPSDALSKFLSMADIHLLPQRADAADLVMPSKLAGMLASGRPIIASATTGTEIASIVQSCGIVVPPENPQLFFEALVTLGSSIALRKNLGLAGYAYAVDKLDKDRVLSSMEEKLKTIVPA